jgi:DNA polymerase-3 subunit delta
LAHELEPGDFRQTLEKLALYKLNDSSPVTFQDISMCAPASNEAEMDDVIHAVAEGRFQDIGPILKRLKSQGTNAVGLCIALARHFKTLLLIVGHPHGPSEGISKLRPPAFGPRRDRLMRQANTWSVGTLKLAVGELTDTDLLLRSANQTAPQMELLERLMVKLAMMSKRRV